MNRRSLLTLSALALAGRAEADPALWSARFKTPGGGELDLGSLQGGWLLVNFWATWCAPCVKEMPDLDRFHAEFAPQGWRVVGLAIDGPTPVREFLARRPVRFPIGLAGLNGTELSKKLGNLKGSLPFTVLANPAGDIVWRHPGETSYQQLKALQRQLRSG